MARSVAAPVLLCVASVIAQTVQVEARADTQQGFILMLHPHGGGDSRVLAAFLTYEEALKAEQEWFATHPNSLDLPSIKEGPVNVTPNRQSTRRTDRDTATATRPPGSSIRMHDLPFVDPGDRLSNSKKPSSLGGKALSGRIGQSRVDFKFEEDGRLRITGELNGEGKWKQDGRLIEMETAKSRFRGQLKTDEIVGVRFTKDGSISPLEWEALIVSTDRNARPNPLAGSAWRSLTGENQWRVRSFNADGTYQDTYGGVVERDNSGKYSWDKDRAHMKANGGNSLKARIVGERLEVIGPSGKRIYFERYR